MALIYVTTVTILTTSSFITIRSSWRNKPESGHFDIKSVLLNSISSCIHDDDCPRDTFFCPIPRDSHKTGYTKYLIPSTWADTPQNVQLREPIKLGDPFVRWHLKKVLKILFSWASHHYASALSLYVK